MIAHFKLFRSKREFQKKKKKKFLYLSSYAAAAASYSSGSLGLSFDFSIFHPSFAPYKLADQKYAASGNKPGPRTSLGICFFRCRCPRVSCGFPSSARRGKGCFIPSRGRGSPSLRLRTHIIRFINCTFGYARGSREDPKKERSIKMKEFFFSLFHFLFIFMFLVVFEMVQKFKFLPKIFYPLPGGASPHTSDTVFYRTNEGLHVTRRSESLP